MRKIFICAHADFPRGGAEANYIEYLALSLIERGVEVYVFSRGAKQEKEYCTVKECYCHNGIYYDNIDGKFESVLDFSRLYFAEAKYIIDLMEKHKATERDQIIFYTTNYFYIRKIYQYAQKRNMKTSMCITEWFQPFQYRGGILNPVYWLDEIGFQFGIPMSKRVIPICRYLETHFQKKGCKTLCLPILADPPEQMPERMGEQEDNVMHFIYSGNAIKKDAIDMIVNSFGALDEQELERVRLHFTGMSKDTVQYLQNACEDAYKKIEAIIHVHDWMDYSDLIALYEKMDFLILLRKKNKVTISNFPSKVPEMMGYGIIPIVSKVGEYTDKYLTDGKDSIQVEQCSVEHGVKAIRKALQLSLDERRRMRRQAYDTAISLFHYKVWSEKIEEFLYGE